VNQHQTQQQGTFDPYRWDYPKGPFHASLPPKSEMLHVWNMISNIYPKMENVHKQYQHYVGSKNNVSKITYDRVHYQNHNSRATYHNWLVVYLPTPLKNMGSSVGIMKFPIYGKINFMFQTTNQIILLNRINS
jgi:hypothetical protein